MTAFSARRGRESTRAALPAFAGTGAVAAREVSWKLGRMRGRLLLIAACCAAAFPAAAQDPPPAEVLERETVSDAGYFETVVPSPGGPFSGYRIRRWIPLGEREPEAGPLRAVVIIDGQGDVGVTAAMARQAEAVLADDAFVVVSVSPADEGVMQSFRRPAWTQDERAALARFARETVAAELRARPDVGAVRLIGVGRGGDVVLTAFGQDPAAFASFHAKDHRLTAETLTALARDLPARGARDLNLRLALSWVQGGGSPDPTALVFLEAVKAKGHAVEWTLNETDDAFLQRSLLR